MKKIIITLSIVFGLFACEKEKDDPVGPYDWSLPTIQFYLLNSEGKNLLDAGTEGTYTNISYYKKGSSQNGKTKFWELNQENPPINYLLFRGGIPNNVENGFDDYEYQIEFSDNEELTDTVIVRLGKTEFYYYLQSVWYNDEKVYERNVSIERARDGAIININK
ncbi:MAG: hypothetical protein Q4G08_06885 [Capnocytophaga sp.]|nr:hypothetical protein [Capnocytophaga sp.]